MPDPVITRMTFGSLVGGRAMVVDSLSNSDRAGAERCLIDATLGHGREPVRETLTAFHTGSRLDVNLRKKDALEGVSTYGDSVRRFEAGAVAAEGGWPKAAFRSLIGFTLVELLVVIALVAILASLLFGTVQSQIRSAKVANSLSNMRQLAGALINFTAENNGRFPDWFSGSNSERIPWDLNILPYLGINDAYTGPPTAAVMKPGLKLDMFRCPLDTRRAVQSGAAYPRSYGITGATVYYPVPSNGAMFSGGIPGRRLGEGLRLVHVTKPGRYVILTRVWRPFETPENAVGVLSYSVFSGPDLNVPPGSPNWERGWGIFGGKTPYAFADGHVSLVSEEEAKDLHPHRWRYDK
jgi:prepilin-type N-terminal cleavage/methylation domain-containing protein/prepilin-type processing-associated H-X9-DG protein